MDDFSDLVCNCGRISRETGVSPGLVCKNLAKVVPVGRVIMPKDMGGQFKILILLEGMASGHEVVVR